MSENKKIKTTEQKIEKALERVRPALQADGGDIELVRYDDDNKEVFVKMLGMCSGCPMAQITLQEGVAKEIKKDVPEIKSVVSV